jgi:DNA-binding MarR family transcriptional regulator
LTVHLLVYIVGSMAPPPASALEANVPTLLRAARATYAAAFRSAHHEAGFVDIPRDGAFVIGSISHGGSPLSEIIARLRISKQAAGQLVETLVLRGYLVRSVDPDDRRRMKVSLTERGTAVATVGRTTLARVDAALVARVGAEYVAHTRATLAALAREDLLDGSGPT